MPKCPYCNAEVDSGQKTCAWCGKELVATPTAQTPPPPQPRPAPPPPAAAPPPTGDQPSHAPSASGARELAKLGDLEGALRLYREILEQDPNDPESLFGIGGVHFKTGEHKKAIEVWLKLKVLDPSYPNLDQWVANAKKNLSPSGLSSLAPTPPPSVQTAPPPPPPPRAPTPPPPPPPPRPVAPLPPQPEEDWQKQTVHVDRIDEEVSKEPAPAPKPQPKPKKEEPEPEPEPIVEEGTNGAPPAWIAKVGWALVVVYIVLIWGIYYF